MKTINTKRLTIRALETNDAPFILSLYNQPLFHRFIGDKNINTIADAVDYIIDNPQKSYSSNGLGLLLVCLHDGTPIGVCGLLKRENLPMPDLGYALDEHYYRQGYTSEACQAVLDFYQEHEQLLAITCSENEASIGLLLGLGFEQMAHSYPHYLKENLYLFKR